MGEVYRMLHQFFPLAYLCLAVFFSFLGVWGGIIFLECDYVVYGVSGRTSWSSDGYTTSNFLGLLLQTYALPLAGIFLLMFGLHSYKSTALNLYFKLILYFGIFFGLTIAAIYANTDYTGGILNCGFFCFGDSSGDGTSGAKVITGVIYVFVALIFSLMGLLLIIRTFFIFYQKISHENLPLLHDSDHVIDSTSRFNSTISKSQKKKSFLLNFILAFGLFFPFIIFTCLVLPDSWASMNVSGIASYAATVESQSLGRVWNWKLSSDVVLKLYPDILIFYLFIYVIVFVGLLAKVNKFVATFLHRRPLLFRGFSIGEVLLISFFSIMFWAEFGYWYDEHQYHHGEAKTRAERAARTLGQLGNFTMGLLLFPASRNSIWSSVFGVPWEAAVRFHRWLGNLFMVIIFLHMCLWWEVYNQQGYFPSNIFKIPLDYSSDNFTINLTFINSLIMFVLIGGCSYSLIRRAKFELFYYAHHFFLAVFIVVLWHATTSWSYILAGVSLYIFDRITRFTRACSVVTVEKLTVEGDGTITKLAYSIESGGSGPWFGKNTPLSHQMGQYCFINIPLISYYQWHPFTISSSPNDSLTTHHIKSMGKNTWTNELLQLAQRFPATEFVVNVDGPYGLPLDFIRYKRIIFVGGGIGVTPLISSFRYLYFLAKDNQLPKTVEQVKLIWVVKDPNVFDCFKQTFFSVANDSCGGKFSFDLFSTAKDETSVSSNLPHFQNGRPNFNHEFSTVEGYGMEAMVFACGPDELMNDCANSTMHFGLDFHAETFKL